MVKFVDWPELRDPTQIKMYLASPKTLINAKEFSEYYEYLTGFKFLETKIMLSRLGVQELIEDYDLILKPKKLEDLEDLEYDPERLEVLRLVQEALQLSAHILAKEQTQLAGQLCGRLQCFEMPDIQKLLEQAKQSRFTLLYPLTASLYRPGGRLIRTLSDHTGTVNAVAVTPDGKQVISASADRTLKVWNLKTGKMERTLSGHTDTVNAVAVTPDGKQVISASADTTLKVWNLKTGKMERTLSGHTLKVWNLKTRNRERILSGHTDTVNAVAVTPDGKQVISASADRTLKVWNLETGKMERTLTGHTDRVRAIAVTPDSKRVISVSVADFRKIIIWNLETGKEQILSVKKVKRNSNRISNDNLIETGIVTITPDGKKVISGSYGNTLRVWNLEKPGKNQGIPIRGFTKGLNPLTISPDNKLVISAGPYKALKVWKLETGKELFTLKTHNDVNAVAVTPDGKQLISISSYDDTLKVWDLEDTAVTNNQIDYFKKSLEAIAFSFNGKWLIKAFSDTSLNALNLEFEKETVISPSFSNTFTFAVTADSKQVISGLSDGKLKICNLETGKKFSLGSYFDYYRDFLSSITDEINCFYFRQTSSQLIRDCNLDTNKERLYPGFYFNYLLCIIFIILLLIWPVSLLFSLLRRLAKIGQVFGSNRSVVSSGRVIFKRPALSLVTKLILVIFSRVKFTEPLYNQVNHYNFPSFLASYFGYYLHIASLVTLLISVISVLFILIIQLVCFCYHKVIRVDYFVNYYIIFAGSIGICLGILWSQIAGIGNRYGFDTNLFFALVRLKHRDKTFAATSNGEQIISASSWGSLRVWDLKKKKKLFTLTGHTKRVTTVAITPDGSLVISGSHDNTLKVWNLQTRNELFTLEGHSGSINAVAITPDGSLVISGSHDNTLKVWNLQTRNELFTLEGHSGSINAVAVTPDGSLVISDSHDNTLKVWDLKTGQELFTLEGYSNLIDAVAVTPNDSLVLFGFSDNTLKVWDLSSGNVIASFTGDSQIRCCAVAPNGIRIGAEPDADGITIGVGEKSGKVHLLRLKKLDIITLRCEYDTSTLNPQQYCPLLYPTEFLQLIREKSENFVARQFV